MGKRATRQTGGAKSTGAVMCVVCAAGCANASVQNVEIESARGLLYLFVKLTRDRDKNIFFYLHRYIHSCVQFLFKKFHGFTALQTLCEP